MTIQKFSSLISKGWGLDHIFVLENIMEAHNHPEWASIVQKLFRKGMVGVEEEITEQGIKLLEFAHDESVEEIVKIAKPRMSVGLEGLHKKLEDRLIHLTGKKEKMVTIFDKRYPFLCNEQDLVTRVKKVMSKYKLTEFQKIEESLLRHIEDCNSRNKWYPLVMYYIIKNENGIENSKMVTDIKSKPVESETIKTDFEI